MEPLEILDDIEFVIHKLNDYMDNSFLEVRDYKRELASDIEDLNYELEEYGKLDILLKYFVIPLLKNITVKFDNDSQEIEIIRDKIELLDIIKIEDSKHYSTIKTWLRWVCDEKTK